MGKVLAAVIAAFALCLGTLAAIVMLGKADDRLAVDSSLSEQLTRRIALAEDRSEDVDFRRLADFPWDRLLIVQPGTPRERISRALGFEWRGDLNFQTGELLIFARDGEVARFADYRGEGRFEGIERPIAQLPRDRSVFTVRSLVIAPK